MGEGGKVGLRIAQLRVQAGMTQKQLADAVGVTQGYVSHLENGRRHVVTRDLLARLAVALSTSATDLVAPVAAAAADDTVTIQLMVPLLRAALDGVGELSLRSPAEQTRDIETAQVARMACDYATLARLLPGLLADTFAAVEHLATPVTVGNFVRVSVAAAIAVRPVGHLDLASRLADHAQRSSRLSGDAVLMAAADYVAAQASLAGGLSSQCRHSLLLAVKAADRIGSPRGDDERVWYGMSHLQAALSSATLGDGEAARLHLTEAAEIARTRPADRWVQEFTEANVGMWKLAAALTTSDSAAAMATVRQIDRSQLRTRQRKARFFGDAGRAYLAVGRPEAAVGALLTALDISSTEVRSRAVLREDVSGLVLSGCREPRLMTLVRRMGIDPLALDAA